MSDLKETLARIRDEAARNGEACAHTRLTDLLENWPAQTDDGAVLNTLEEPAPSSPTHGLDRDTVAKVLRGHWLNQDGVHCACGAWIADMYSLHLADAVLATAVDLTSDQAITAAAKAVEAEIKMWPVDSNRKPWEPQQVGASMHDIARAALSAVREMGAGR